MRVNLDGNIREYRTLWMEGASVFMIDQPKIPHSFEIVELKRYQDTARAIKDMVVRGAGAIGAAGGFAMAQAAIEASEDNFLDDVSRAETVINCTRPTAQDLFYATARVARAIRSKKDAQDARKAAIAEAQKIADENASACEMIGRHGEKLIHDNMRILTHCNAGWLAFVDWGSALSPIYAAKRQGKGVFVYADETRPRCQGARLTAWELGQEGVNHVVIADNASGYYMRKGDVDLVIVGADRIALNGDVANKIGTYEKAVLAHENGIPFYVAAPMSTIDISCKNGDGIPIEERSQDEVLYMFGWSDELGRMSRVRIAPRTSRALNPAFDVTPAKYVTGIITEKGIIKANEKSIRGLF
ncbi:MAG: S-methyl-5-thioribose-1-phosphate isomerase [archaeon]